MSRQDYLWRTKTENIKILVLQSNNRCFFVKYGYKGEISVGGCGVLISHGCAECVKPWA